MSEPRDPAGPGPDLGLSTPRRDRVAAPPDDLEDRLRDALRVAPAAGADLQQVITRGRARGTTIRRRRRALAVVGTAVVVSAVVGAASVLLPRTPSPRGGPVAAGTPSGSPAPSASGSVEVSATRPVPPPAGFDGPGPVVPAQPGDPQSIAVGGDGRLLAISAQGLFRGSSDDDSVRLFDVTDPVTPTAVGRIRVPGGYAVSVSISPDGGLLAVAWEGGAVRLYDLADPADPRLLQTLPVTTSRVATVQFGPVGRLLATGGYDDVARVWQLAAPGPGRWRSSGPVSGT